MTALGSDATPRGELTAGETTTWSARTTWAALGAVLAARLSAGALGAAAAASVRGRWAPALLAAALAALAATARYEALLTCGGAALVLALLVARRPDLGAGRRAGAALAVGALAGEAS